MAVPARVVKTALEVTLQRECLGRRWLRRLNQVD